LKSTTSFAGRRRARPEAAASGTPPLPRGASKRITIIEDVTEFAEIAGGWERLERKASTPMQTALWSRTAAESLYRPGRLKVAVLGDLDEPRAITPLALALGGVRAELIGAAELGEPADLLFSEEQAVEEMARALADLKLPLLLGRLPGGSPSVDAIRTAHRRRAGVVVREVPGAPTIPLSPEWTAPEGLLSKRRASDMRRARRRAEALGGVSFEVLAPTPAELEPLFREAVEAEAAGWKSRRGSALKADAGRLDFYTRYARGAAERDELRLCFMRIDGRAVAMQLAVEWRDRFWLLKIGYDEDFARCSPGMLLMLESTRWAANRGLRSVELLGTPAPWTDMWTEEVRPCVTVGVYPAGPRGIAALVADGTRHAARRVATHIETMRRR
jgi:CelD/BcsL family acetyltransferase involved in cellulose biosynthesis